MSVWYWSRKKNHYHYQQSIANDISKWSTNQTNMAISFPSEQFSPAENSTHFSKVLFLRSSAQTCSKNKRRIQGAHSPAQRISLLRSRSGTSDVAYCRMLSILGHSFVRDRLYLWNVSRSQKPLGLRLTWTKPLAHLVIMSRINWASSAGGKCAKWRPKP